MAGKPDSRRRPPQDRGPRINHQIRIRQVRVIDEDNSQLGVLETADALALAKESLKRDFAVVGDSSTPVAPQPLAPPAPPTTTTAADLPLENAR